MILAWGFLAALTAYLIGSAIHERMKRLDTDTFCDGCGSLIIEQPIVKYMLDGEVHAFDTLECFSRRRGQLLAARQEAHAA